MSSVTLHQLPPGYDRPVSVSPFCAKLEVYFRLAKIDYTTEVADYRKAPNGKVPYITFEGKMRGDSHEILAWCKEHFGNTLDKGLSQEQHHLGHLIRRTVENHLYFAHVYSRFQDEDGWAYQKEVVKGILPAALRPILTGVIRKSVTKSLHGHGLARHDKAIVYRHAAEDLQAIAGTLGGKDFIVGDTPTSYDCALWPVLDGIETTPSDNALKAAYKSHEALVAYHKRLDELLAWG